jgi:hypothetical protein
MDIVTIIFVAFLCAIAFILTVTVRRDFRAKERQRREQNSHSHPPPPRRKP